MQKWGSLFQKHILQRGWAYARAGNVVVQRQSEREIVAMVHGTELYEVTIGLDENGIRDMKCSCPYAEDGKACKHMAAVLALLFPDEKQKERADTPIQTAMPASHGAAGSAHTAAWYLDQLYRLAKRYADRTGYIDYAGASRFAYAVENFLNPVLEELRGSEDRKTMLQVTTGLCKLLTEIDLDDSDGVLCSLSLIALDTWEWLVQFGMEAEQERYLFDWLCKRLQDEKYDWLYDIMADFLYKNFLEPAFLQRKRALAMEQEQKNGYAAADWALRCVKLTQAMHVPEQELTRLVKTYWKYPKIRNWAVEECLRRGDTTEAIRILKESKKRDAGYCGLVTEYTQKLIGLYREIGDEKACRHEWMELARMGGTEGLRAMRELKAMTPAAQWPEVRETIFRSVRNTDLLPDYFLQEQLYDRLLEAVLSAPGLRLVTRFDTVLCKRYPEPLLQRYEETVRAMAARARNRSDYWRLAQAIRHMKKYESGKARAGKLVDELCAAYPRRTAMHDELGRSI